MSAQAIDGPRVKLEMILRRQFPEKISPESCFQTCCAWNTSAVQKVLELQFSALQAMATWSRKSTGPRSRGPNASLVGFAVRCSSLAPCLHVNRQECKS